MNIYSALIPPLESRFQKIFLQTHYFVLDQKTERDVKTPIDNFGYYQGSLFGTSRPSPDQRLLLQIDSPPFDTQPLPSKDELYNCLTMPRRLVPLVAVHGVITSCDNDDDDNLLTSLFPNVHRRSAPNVPVASEQKRAQANHDNDLDVLQSGRGNRKRKCTEF